jgi:homopolymeric O-antigen transport system ATP-binding protein
MSNIAISVENLSKKYKIGELKNRHDTLRDHITHSFQSLFRMNSQQVIGSRNDVYWALKDISFDVKEGEVVGIIGHNGAGKSTLLKILTQITAPTSGYAKLHGHVSSLLEVGTGFHPDLTGRENIFLNGAILGMPKEEIRRKFDEIVAFAEVEKFIDTPVKRYSTGMGVRLAFAVAAHLEPEILLIDEVLAVGDASFQQKCLGKMGRVAKEGRTILFVSHNMAAMASLTNRCVWLEHGKVREIGPTQHVIESYLNSMEADPQVAGFVSLTSRPRPKGTSNTKARFEWVRMRDSDGNQGNVLGEGEPMVVELGFQVLEESLNLQFGVGVSSLMHTEEDLFLNPSPRYPVVHSKGHYCVRMNIDPNFLRVGSYSLIVKMFADGVRQETMGDVLRFRIAENKMGSGGDSVYQPWQSGFFKFDYEWESVKPYEQSETTEKVFQ